MGGTVAGEVGVPVCEGKFLQGDLSMVNRPRVHVHIVTAAFQGSSFSSSSSCNYFVIPLNMALRKPKTTRKPKPAPPKTFQKAPPKACTKAKAKPEDVKIDSRLKQICPNDALRKAQEEPKAPASPPAATAKAATTAPAAATPPPAAIAKVATAEAATPPPAATAKATTADPSAAPASPVKLPSYETPQQFKAEINSSSKRPLQVTHEKAFKKVRSNLSSPPPPTTLGGGTESNSQEAAGPMVSPTTLACDELYPATLAALDAKILAASTPAETTVEGENIPTTAAPGRLQEGHNGRWRLSCKTPKEEYVLNIAFRYQYQYMKDFEPQLNQHFEDLLKTVPKDSEAINEFKKAVAENPEGQFDNPKLMAIKKLITIKECLQPENLASWTEVVNKYGPVAHTAMREGILPYVPNRLLHPGHRVKWPESHEFVINQRWWSSTWKDTLSYILYSLPSQETFDGFLNAQAGRHITGIVGVDALHARAFTDMPDVIAMLEGPAETAPTAITPQERAVHPDHSVTLENDMHDAILTSIRKFCKVWPTQASKVRQRLMRIHYIPEMGAYTFDQITHLTEKAEAGFKVIVNSAHPIQLAGRGYVTRKVYDHVRDIIDEISYTHKQILGNMKILDTIISACPF